MTGSGGGGDTRVAAFFFGLEKESVCWPLGSLRLASIFSDASTAFLTTDEHPFVESWSTATHSTFEYWDGSSTSTRWTWTAYLVEVIECESGFFARSPL